MRRGEGAPGGARGEGGGEASTLLLARQYLTATVVEGGINDASQKEPFLE